MKRYDIGIVGIWCGENYGSLLTYYSLVQLLKSYGKSVIMLESPLPENNDENKKDSNSRIFCQNHYDISNCNISDYNKLCDTFILGSDQVFNPGIYNFFRNFFLLPFADKSKKIIAYAGSFGHNYGKFPAMERRKLKLYLKRFDGISVRECSALDILKDVGIDNAVSVLDPIFLSDIDVYEDLIKESPPIDKKGYLLNYILDPDENKRNLILKVSNHLNRDYVNILDGILHKFENNKATLNLENIINRPTVQEVLAYYRNSDFVITDSFHGVCLSIIFKKPFIAIMNRYRGIARFENLFNKLAIKDKLLNYDFIAEDVDVDMLTKDINYDEIYNVLFDERVKSLNWLKEQLDKPKKNVKPQLIDYLLDIYFKSGIEYSWVLPFLQYVRCSLLALINYNKRNHYKEKAVRMKELYKSRRMI